VQDCEEQEERAGKLRAERDPSKSAKYWRFDPTGKPLRRHVLCSRLFSPDIYGDTPRVQVGHGISEIRPCRHALAATLLVELDASVMSLLPGSNDRLKSGRYAEMTVLHRNCLADLIRDLHAPTAVRILTSRRCCKAARTVAVFAGDCKLSGELGLLHATSDDSLRLLDLPGLKGSHVAEL
jgi:hypothetical protein